MTRLTITQTDSTDYLKILALNELAVPSVNSIGIDTLDALHRQSAYLGVARYGEEIVGFLLALPHTADYGSLNFQYFKQRYTAFAYVDRVVVASRNRNLGVGAALYEDLHRHLGADFPLLACEVNIDPPNPGSLRFHQRLGFRQIGSQQTEGGAKRVALLIKSAPWGDPKTG